jgi:hypothetical protein
MEISDQLLGSEACSVRLCFTPHSRRPRSALEYALPEQASVIASGALSGAIPTQGVRSCPFRNALRLRAAAITSIEVAGPTPGIAVSPILRLLTIWVSTDMKAHRLTCGFRTR